MAMMKKLTSAIVASSLVLGLVGTAGATTPDKVQAAAERMAALGLVQGKGGPDLALGDSITRAELVTVIVRAFGQESNSRLLKGVAAFPDTADHWASGYVAMATKLIAERTNGTEVVGMPDGTFKPDQPVTAGEAVAFLMKFIGAQKDNSLPWPDNYLQGALNAGIITAEDLANLQGVKNAPATRGLAFYLADSAFYGYKLAEGSTVYRTFVDTVAPEIAITTEGPVTTIQPKITISGTVANAQSVFIGTPDNVVPVVDGTFTAEVELAMGDNNIVVSAVDLVGNVGTASLKVTRTTGPAVGIAAEDITVAAGETIDVAAAVVDEVGNALEGYTITGESNVGTFADGKFTAGTKAGEGKLVLKAGENGEFTKEVKVTVTPAALAKVVTETPIAAGQPTRLLGTDVYGNPIPGVTFSENSADAYIDGEYFIAAKEGTYTVWGTLGDVTVESVIGAYGESNELVVEAPKSIVANGETEITVTVKAVDKNGLQVADFHGYVAYVGDLDPEEPIVEMKDGVATFTFTADESLADEEIESEFALYETYKEASQGRKKDRVAEGEFTIEVEEQVATSIAFDAPEYLVTNHDIPAEIEVIVLDQAGVEMKDDEEYEFEFSIDGPALFEENEEDEWEAELASGDSFFIIADGDETGKVTITAQVDGLKSGKVTLEAAEGGKPSSIQITVDEESVKAGLPDDDLDDDQINVVTVQIVDRKGVPTADDDITEVEVEVSGVVKNGTIYVDGDRVTGDTIPVEIDPETGKGSFTLVSPIAQKISLVAKHDDLKDSKAVETAFTPSDANAIGFKNNVICFLEANASDVTVAAQLYDKYGNPVAKRGVESAITLFVPDGKKIEINGEEYEDGEEVETYFTDKNGQIVLNIETPRSVDGVGIHLKPSGDILAGQEDIQGQRFDKLNLVAQDYVPASIRVEVVTDPAKADGVSSITPDDTVYLRATIKDNEGHFYDNDMSGVLKVTTNAALDLTDLKWKAETKNDKLTGVYYSEQISGPGAQELIDTGKVTFQVELLAVEDQVIGKKTVTVKEGSPAQVELEKKSIEVNANKRTTVDFKLVDAAGNETKAKGDVKVRVTVSGQDGADVRVAYNDTVVKSGETFTIEKGKSGGEIEIAGVATGDVTVRFKVVGSSEPATTLKVKVK